MADYAPNRRRGPDNRRKYMSFPNYLGGGLIDLVASGAVNLPIMSGAGLRGLYGLLQGSESDPETMEAMNDVLAQSRGPSTPGGEGLLGRMGELYGEYVDEPLYNMGAAVSDQLVDDGFETVGPMVGALARTAPEAAGYFLGGGGQAIAKGANPGYVRTMRPRQPIEFTTETAVTGSTKPGMTPNPIAANEGVANIRAKSPDYQETLAGRQRLNQALDDPNIPANLIEETRTGQGAWAPESGMVELNPAYTMQLRNPPNSRSGNVLDDTEIMRLVGQTSQNLMQDANAVGRFVPQRMTDYSTANALEVRGLTPQDIRQLGAKGEFVVIDRGNGRVHIKNWGDNPGVRPLVNEIKSVNKKAKIKGGRMDDDIDNVFLMAREDKLGRPRYPFARAGTPKERRRAFQQDAKRRQRQGLLYDPIDNPLIP